MVIVAISSFLQYLHVLSKRALYFINEGDSNIRHVMSKFQSSFEPTKLKNIFEA